MRGLVGVGPTQVDLGPESESKARKPSSCRRFSDEKSDAFIVARKRSNARGAKGRTGCGPGQKRPCHLRRRMAQGVRAAALDTFGRVEEVRNEVAEPDAPLQYAQPDAGIPRAGRVQGEWNRPCDETRVSETPDRKHRSTASRHPKRRLASSARPRGAHPQAAGWDETAR